MSFQPFVIECRGCGASVTLDPTIRSGVCPYCGSNNIMEVDSEEAKQAPAVEEIFPARISEESFRNAVRAFLCTDPDVPDSLYETLEERELVLTFMPLYKHTITWSSNWTADIGYEDNENNGKVAWQGVSGQTNGTAEVYSPASNFLLNQEFGLDCCVAAEKSSETPLPFTPEHLQDISYLRCDCAPEAGEKEYTAPQLDVHIHNNSIENVPGDYQKNFHYTHQIHDHQTVLQMVPFWLFIYEWQGNTYYCLQDACSGEIKGTLPTTSKRKITSWILTAALVLVTGTVALGLWKLRSPYDAGLFLALTYPLMGAGLVYREIIAFKKSKVKFAHESQIGSELHKIKKFEASFISKTATLAGIWLAAALAVVFAAALLLPIWRDPLVITAPKAPYMKQELKQVTKLKKKKIAPLTEEFIADDGTIFVVEQ